MPRNLDSVYESLIDADDEERSSAQTAVRAATAPDANPDRFAQARVWADKTGIPLDVVERNPEVVKREVLDDEYSRLIDESPGLRRHVAANPDFAKLAGDELGVQAEIARLLGAKDFGGRAPPSASEFWLGAKLRGEVLESLPAAAALGYNSIAPSLAFSAANEGIAQREELLNQGISPNLPRLGVRESPLARQTRLLERDLQSEKRAAEALEQIERDEFLVKPKDMGMAEEALWSFTRSATPTVAGAAASLLNPYAGLLIGTISGGAVSGAQETYEARQKGATRRVAALAGGINALMETGGEALPLKLAGNMGHPIIKKLTELVLVNAGQEAATQAGQILSKYLLYDPSITIEQALREITVAAGAGAIGGLFYGTTIGGPGMIREWQARSEQFANDNLRNTLAGADRAKAANDNAAAFAEAVSKIEGAALMQRDPRAQAAYIESLSQGGRFPEVYLDGALLQEQIDAGKVKAEDLSQETLDQIPDAIEFDGTVRIPTSEYVVAFVGKPVNELVQPNLRFAPDAMNQTEAKVFLQTQTEMFAAAAKQAELEHAADQPFHDGARVVEEFYRAQLTSMSRFNEAQNEAYVGMMRAFYVTLADRQGTTPDVLLKEYQVSIQVGDTPVDLSLAQGAQITPEQRNLEAQALAEFLVQKHGLETFGVWVDEFDEIHIGMLRTPEGQRGGGRGRAAMKEFLDWADQRGESLTLEAVPLDLDLPQGVDLESREGRQRAIKDATERLVKFYESLGFEIIDPRTNLMRRAPSLDFTLFQGGRKIAVREQHPVRAGRIVGAPDWIPAAKTPEEKVAQSKALRQFRKLMRALAIEGEPGRFWYENSSKAFLNFAGGDVKLASTFVGLASIYSPQRRPPANTTIFLHAYYDWLAGRPITLGAKDQIAKATALLNEGTLPDTIKVGSFWQNLMVEIDAGALKAGVSTMDMWMALAGNYGSISLSGEQYRFMELEIKNLSAEFGWPPHQVQAAIWTAIKARIDNKEMQVKLQLLAEKQGFEKESREWFKAAHELGMSRPAPTEEEINASRVDFSDTLRDRAAQMSWEIAPGESAGLIPGYHAATPEQKAEYMAAVREALTGDKGQDLIAEALGIPAGLTVEGFGAWAGEIGTSFQTLLPVFIEGQRARRKLSADSRKLVEAYAALRGYVLSQDSVGWHHPVFDDATTNHNGINLATPRALTPAEAKLLYARLQEKFNTWEIPPIYSTAGVRLINLNPALKNTEFQKGVAEVMAGLPEDFGGGSLDARSFRSDGRLISNNWRESTDGEIYTAAFGEGRPDVLKRARDLRARVATVNERFSKKLGWDAKRYDQSAPGFDGRAERDPGLEQAQDAARRAAGTEPALVGLPQDPMRMPDGTWYYPGPSQKIAETARRYMLAAGLPVREIQVFNKVDTDRAARIADAYEAMEHLPADPAVLAAYQAMAQETINQYDFVIRAGLKVEFFDPAKGDPYAGNPRLAIKDIVENNHMWVFSTRDGYGRTAAKLDPSASPMLADSGRKIGGKPALVNDLFRVVHDYFGHVRHGVGFRANGEENAWRSHAMMYSDAALPAVTAETRGQSAWINFGPHGEKNRGASAADTVYSDQKVGLLPDWTWKDGLEDEVSLEQQQSGGTRGGITFPANLSGTPAIVTLLQNADFSTFVHESGHFFLEVLIAEAGKVNASQGLVDDVNRIMKWFGTDVDTFRKMTLAEKRPHHEQWARGFEAYTMEGKAPSLELRGLFGKFRAWMTQVYRTLTSLNVSLTDEVRGVFDRMLASDTMIHEAERVRGLRPLFPGVEASGMTLEEWEEYQKLGVRATDEAVAQTDRAGLRDMAWTRRATSRALRNVHKDVAEKRAAMKAEIMPALEAEPVYAAGIFLRHGEVAGEKTLGEHRLSLPALKEMYGDHPAAPWRYFPTGKNSMVTAEGGVHPDQVAQLFGFRSGDELVRSLLAAEPLNERSEQETDRAMVEKYGDIQSPAAQQKLAESAVHNEVRTRHVATELRALLRSTGPEALLRKAAKLSAEEVMERKRVRDVRPAQFEAIATRAAKAAEAALAKGNIPASAAQKRNQLFGIYGARVAHGVIEEVEKALRYLRKFDSAGTRANLDPDYLDQIDKLLDRYQLSPITAKEARKRAGLMDWIKAQEENLGVVPEIDQAIVDEARRISYQDATVEEFRGLVDAVKSIEHIGRLKHKLIKARDEREFRAIVKELGATIRERSGTAAIKERAGEPGKLKTLGKWGKWFLAAHRRFASLMQQMDGFEEGGPMWEHFTRPMNEAGNQETEMTAAANAKMRELLLPLREGGKLNQKIHIPEIGESLTREQIIGIALNMGNATNLERVTTGEKWSPQQLNAVLAKLGKLEWDVVQSVWDYLESFRPEIAAKQKRVTGVEPEWVEAAPVVTPFGVYRGGYWPIAYDPSGSIAGEQQAAGDVQRQMERGLAVRSTTRRGHLEERAKSTGLGMRYDFTYVLVRHVNDVVRDLSWHEFLIDANRMLRSESVQGAIREHYGSEVFDVLKTTLRDIAIGRVPARNAIEKGANHLAKGASIAGLGYNLVTTALQPLGLFQSAQRIGAWNVLRGLGAWIGNPIEMVRKVEEINAMSPFMRERGRTQQRELNDLLNEVGNTPTWAERFGAFYFIQVAQRFADVPTWLGQYEAMLREGKDQATAVALADQAVIDSQGNGSLKDLSQVMRGGPMMRLWTVFYSYFNTSQNLLAEAHSRFRIRDPLAVPKLASAYLMVAIFPTSVALLLRGLLKGEIPDDEEELAKKLLVENLSFMFGLFLGARELSQVVTGYGDYTGPAGGRFFASAAKLIKQVGQGEFDEALVRAAKETAGPLLHLPTVQAQRVVDALIRMADGEDVNPIEFIGGKPSKK